MAHRANISGPAPNAVRYNLSGQKKVTLDSRHRFFAKTVIPGLIGFFRELKEVVMQEIVIDFEADGEVHLEGKGFQGKTCDAAMGHFEQALGVVKERKNKPEYFRAEVKGDARVKAR